MHPSICNVQPQHGSRRVSIRIAVYSSERVVINNLVDLIAKSPNLIVASTSTDPTEFLSLIEGKKIDAIVVTLCPTARESDRGFCVLKSAHKYPTVVVTEPDRKLDFMWLAMVGVRAIIADCSTANISLAVQSALQGGAFIGKELVERFLLENTAGKKELLCSLSNIEKELIIHTCNGFSSTAIGTILNKSPRTIEGYRSRLYRKLGVHTKEQLIVWFLMPTHEDLVSSPTQEVKYRRPT